MTFDEIDQEYFNLACNTGASFYKQVQTLGRSKEVMEALTNEDELKVFDDKSRSYGGLNSRLLLAAIHDVLTSYEGLDRKNAIIRDLGLPKPKMKLDNNEGYGLASLMLRFLNPGRNDVYESVEGIESQGGLSIASEFINLVKKGYKNPHEGDGFLLVRYLRAYGVNKEMVNQYIIKLYRFANVMAKGDNQITEQESAWLASIMGYIQKSPTQFKDIDDDDFNFLDNDDLNADEEENTEPENETPKEPEEPAEERLKKLVGLATVKEEVNKLTSFLKIQQLRKEKGLKIAPISYHCVFTGNPGTGKTTVARILAGIYKELGILKKGQLIETDRSGLVAEFVGQTAVKTNKIIDSALDGVLFIDEAYSLVAGGENDFGGEAIATLLKRMEDDRDRLIVILAGYSNEMQNFIDSNPGLQSRFNRYITFDDYNAEELMEIFKRRAEDSEYKLTEDAEKALKDLLDKAIAGKDQNFGNGRFVRNLFEKAIERQAVRLASETDLTEDKLCALEPQDLEDEKKKEEKKEAKDESATNSEEKKTEDKD